MKKRIFSCFLCILLSFCFATTALADTSSEGSFFFSAKSNFINDPAAIEQKAQSMFLVEIYDENAKLIGTGSGFVAFDEHLFITNHHVVEDAAFLTIYDDMGNSHIIDLLIAADEQLDIAILEFDAGSNYDALNLKANPNLRRGQQVLAIGSPKGILNTVSEGNISAILNENGVEIIQFTAPISHGSSGGALFDDSGNIIGLVFAKHIEGENMNYALNIQSVIDFKNLNAHGNSKSLIAYNQLNTNSEKNNPALNQKKTSDYILYTHPTQGYSVEYPESWIALDSTNIEAMMKSLADNEEFSSLNLEAVVPQITQMEMTMFMDIFGTNINIVGQEVGMSLTASAFLPMMPQMAQQVTASLPDAKLLDTGSLYEIGGNQYCTLCASYTLAGSDLYVFQFYAFSGTTMYLITLTMNASVADMDTVEAYTDHLLETLVLPAA